MANVPPGTTLPNPLNPPASPSGGNSNPQPGHSLVDATAVQLLGIGLFTILAGMNEDLGDVLVIIMWGIFLGWLLIHTADFAKMVKAL